MLIHDNLAETFYQQILKKCSVTSRILLICALDVDALCACKILQTLFNCDNLQSSIKPVCSNEDLYNNYWKHKDDHDFIVLVNCGGTIDITDLLCNSEEGEEENDFEEHGVEVFIIDSHRPLNLINVFTDKPVHVVLKQSDDHNSDYDFIPKFEDIYRDDNEDNDFDESEGGVFDREKWKDNRKKLLESYHKFYFHGTSSAYVLFDLAWRMSKDTNELLWLAILSVCEQYHNHKIDKQKYTSNVVSLIADLKRLKNQREGEMKNVSVNVLKLQDINELDLCLYRQWTIVESLAHSPSMFINFKLWSEKGERRVCKFLGDMGLPLSQAKQNFTYMDNEFVEDFQSLFKEALEKHVKNQQDRSIKTFLASSGYQEEISAQDAVWALDTMLKSYLHTSQSTTNLHSQQFFTAFNCLEGQGQQGGQSIVKLTPGFNLAKLTLKAIISNVRNILTSRQIQQVGAVLYFSFSLTNPDLDRIAPVLTLFTLILRDAFIKSLPSKRRLIAWDLPLLVCVPRIIRDEQDTTNIEAENQENLNDGDMNNGEVNSGQGLNTQSSTMEEDIMKPTKLMIYGCPPSSSECSNTIMPAVFEQVKDSTNVDYERMGFDPSFIQIPYQDKHVFIETITAILSSM